jgi:hypothetical protein
MENLGEVKNAIAQKKAMKFMNLWRGKTVLEMRRSFEKCDFEESGKTEVENLLN